MEDKELQKEKYKNVWNREITFGDLYFRAVNPLYNKRVVIQPGEYILTELLDFNDLKKSRLSGALKSFIEMQWIEVENPATTIEKRHTTNVELAKPHLTSTINELTAGTINAKDVTNLVATAAQPKSMLSFPEDKQPKIVEVVSREQSRTVNSFGISEIAAQTDGSKKAEEAYEKFASLRYFQKLKAIREATDIALLETISTKSNYPQLVHNSKTRLRELQNTVK